MYYIIFITLILFTFLELLQGKINKNLTISLLLIISIMAIFRYGQGSDYFEYESLYNYTYLNSWHEFKDSGYSFLSAFAKSKNISFDFFSGFISGITMFLVCLFVKRNKYSMLSLLFVYCLFFFPYITSSIREGFTIFLFASIAYPFYRKGGKKNLIYYEVIILLGSTIHASLLVVIIIPLLDTIKLQRRSLNFIFIITSILLILNIHLPVSSDFGYFTERISTYNSETGMLPRIVRFFIMLIIMLIPNKYLNSELIKYKKYILFGYLLYVLFMFSDTLSSRIQIYFRIFEIFIFTSIFTKKISKSNITFITNKQKKITFKYLVIAYVCVYTILGCKCIINQIQQGDYVNNYLPYISVFNKGEILQVRKDFD